jgi:hypothetical protein
MTVIENNDTNRMIITVMNLLHMIENDLIGSPKETLPSTVHEFDGFNGPQWAVSEPSVGH